jgi:hypothetical protein
MNDLYYNIIIIVLVLVLFLAYILIAYFYTSYSNYKGDVDDNFEKTKNYINTSISKIDDNIRSSITENNNKINNTSNYINEINKKVSRVELKSEDNYNENKKSINNFNLDLNNTKSQLSSNGENLNKFDTNIKQFIQFKSNGTTINEAIYKYQFGVSPNLSLDLLRNVNAISGMTIETDNISNFRLCDKNKNCMDMNIKEGGLNIFPTNSTNNTTDNILIYDKNKEKVLAKFDLKNRGIYLGGAGEDAGMYIQDSNVYVKNIKLLVDGAFYNQKIINFDKSIDNPYQIHTNYPMDITDFNKDYLPKITGIYSIIKGTKDDPNNTIIFNFMTSGTIPIGNSFIFYVNELLKDITKPNISIATNFIETTNINIDTANIYESNYLQIKQSTIISPNYNYRIKIKSSDIVIDPKFTESTITNLIYSAIIPNINIKLN